MRDIDPQGDCSFRDFRGKITAMMRNATRNDAKYGLALAAAFCLSAGTARAELSLCNQSFDVLNIALGQPAETSVVTRGWWRVAPNQCATLIRGDLHSRFVYVFAADVFGNEALSGATPLCVGTRRFEIDRQQDCLLRGLVDARFVEIDTGEQTSWTVFVTPRPDG